MMISQLVVSIVVLLFAFSTPLLSQNISINEIVSSNSTTLADEDGDYSDWIELYNSGSQAIQLQGYFLSDDTGNVQKWTFPEYLLDPDDYLLVFASDKDRNVAQNGWETIISWGDNWRYFSPIAEPPSNWREINFDDSSWLEGKSGLGYGDNDDSTTVAPRLSLFIRHTFFLQDASDIGEALLNIDYDDGFVAYLNGTEVARRTMGTPNSPPPAFNETASGLREAEIYQGGYPELVAGSEIVSLLVTGTNVLTVQVHNDNAGSSDLTIIPFLTLGSSQNTGGRGVHPLVSPNIPALHTNFKISSGGETLILSDPSGTIVNQLAPIALPTNISYGRQSDGSNSLFYFDSPTPGASNNTTGFQQILQSPTANLAAGFYSQPQQLELNAASGTIRYTTNGSKPTSSSPVYSVPLTINSTSNIRARAFQPGSIPSETITHSYFINQQHDLATISISFPPASFFNTDSGIYVLGNNYDPNFPFFGANFWEDWEREVHLELFEENGNLAMSLGAGAKIFGGWSRGNPQKSLSLFARNVYGANSFDYQLFEEKPIVEFESFILRNAGNDWNTSMFRDALTHQLIREANVDYLAYRPAAVYLNGDYWGIHNIREKINEHFLANNHDVDADEVDLLEFDAQVIEGSNSHYLQMLNFIQTQDLNVPANYEQVQRWIDIDSYCTYKISQLYVANQDWPGSNIKYWRPRSEDGRWRWILFDTDFGYGLFLPNAQQANMIAFATEVNGPEWPNPPWSTLLLRRLLTSNEFKVTLLNKCADMLNQNFLPANVISVINSITATLQSEMPIHFARWGGSISNWNNNIAEIKIFASQRPFFMRQNFENYFSLSGQSTITLNASPQIAGSVQINSVQPNSESWQGIYFNGNPVTLKAIPNPGYQFSGWIGASLPASDSVTYVPTSDVTITAQFALVDSFDIVINEINYNSSAAVNPEDWVEFYNNSNRTADISNWYFSDEEDTQIFPFPNGTILQQDSFLVICRDTSLFQATFPNATNVLGNFSFGLSGGGELVRLFDASGQLVDSLTYNDVAPWPTEADGNGPTLSLINPNLDNALAQNWRASMNFGTPGMQNDVFTGIDDVDPIEINSFQLQQNYPNPFNPQTTIQFRLPTPASIELTVYDLTGRRVDVVAAGQYSSGVHNVVWNPQKNIASGIYFYRLTANNSDIGTRKLILMR
ncbi:MAG: CotH kinase family protein [Calditrichia bacterium]